MVSPREFTRVGAEFTRDVYVAGLRWRLPCRFKRLPEARGINQAGTHISTRSHGRSDQSVLVDTYGSERLSATRVVHSFGYVSACG